MRFALMAALSVALNGVGLWPTAEEEWENGDCRAAAE